MKDTSADVPESMTFYREDVPAIGWPALRDFIEARGPADELAGADVAHAEGRPIEVHTSDGLIAVCPGTDTLAFHQVHIPDSLRVEVAVREGWPEKILALIEADEQESLDQAQERREADEEVLAVDTQTHWITREEMQALVAADGDTPASLADALEGLGIEWRSSDPPPPGLIEQLQASVAADLRERGNDDVKARIDEMLELAAVRKEQSRRAIIRLTYADVEKLFGMPAEFQVVSIFEQPMTSSLCFVVQGPDLRHLAPGAEIPVINGSWNEIPLRVPKTEDNAELVAEWLTDDEGEYTFASRFEWRLW